MRHSQKIRFLGLPILFTFLLLAVQAQWEKKPYAQWSEKEAQKVLNDSPWAKTQVFSSPYEMFRSPVGNAPQPGRQGRAGDPTAGTPAQSIHINFRVRLLSARPIRQAFSRLIVLNQTGGRSVEAIRFGRIPRVRRRSGHVRRRRARR